MSHFMTKKKYNYYQVFDDNFQQYCILLNIYDYDFILPPHTIFCQAFCENILISGVSIRGMQYIFLSCTQIRFLIYLGLKQFRHSIYVSQTMRVTTFIHYLCVAINFLVHVFVQNGFLISFYSKQK